MKFKAAILPICATVLLLVLSSCSWSNAGNEGVYIVPSHLDGNRNESAEEEILAELEQSASSSPITLSETGDAYSYFKPILDHSGELSTRKDHISIKGADFQEDSGTLLLEYRIHEYEGGVQTSSYPKTAQIWAEQIDGKWVITRYKVTP